jgi:hypothetical protein
MMLPHWRIAPIEWQLCCLCRLCRCWFFFCPFLLLGMLEKVFTCGTVIEL